jgi:hypothetical protein
LVAQGTATKHRRTQQPPSTQKPVKLFVWKHVCPSLMWTPFAAQPPSSWRQPSWHDVPEELTLQASHGFPLLQPHDAAQSAAISTKRLDIADPAIARPSSAARGEALRAFVHRRAVRDASVAGVDASLLAELIDGRVRRARDAPVEGAVHDRNGERGRGQPPWSRAGHAITLPGWRKKASPSTTRSASSS